MKKFLYPLLALFCMISCMETELSPVLSESGDDFYASIESVGATRTAMDENNNVLWSEEDQLVIFRKTTLGDRYQIKEQYVGTTTGGFSKISDSGSGDDFESGNEIDHNVALYPYSTSIWCMKNDSYSPTRSYKLNVVLPEVQHYAENTFGNGSFPMIAVSSTNQLTFKNVCGGLKLQFKGVDKIMSIKLEGLGGDLISGKSTVVGYVDGSAPVITMDASKATKSITLDCGDGVQLKSDVATTFIISVPPVTFQSGMKLTIKDADGMSRVLTNGSSNTIKRSSLLTFPVITYRQEGVFEIEEGTLTSYELLAEGGTIEIPVTTNQDYEVVIPEGAGEWISVAETKVLRDETITLNVAENTTPEARSAEVQIVADGEVLQVVNVNQEGIPLSPNRVIYYKSTDGEIITASGTKPFGATMISNTYEDGQGMMIFSSDVTKIGEEAFRSCTRLKEIQLPPSLMTIEYEAFTYCSNLESAITIPESVSTIEGRAFMGCNKVPAFYGKYSSSDNKALVKNGVMLAFAASGISDYTTPSEVTMLGDWLFYDCGELKSLTISDNVTEIGDYAVYYCRSLESVNIGNNVTSIGREAFWACKSLDHIVVPAKVSYVGDNAFDTYYLKSIKFLSEKAPAFASQYIFSESLPLIYVPYDSFGEYYDSMVKYQTHIIGWKSDDEQDIQPQNEIWYNSNSLLDVDYSAFGENDPRSGSLSGGVGYQMFESDIITIGDYAFEDNENLAALSFPEGTVTLGSSLFSGCSKLTSVTIPSTVTEIGHDLIYNLSKFRSLYCKATVPPTVDSELFYFTTNMDGIKIYVPFDSVDAYKAADVWKDHSDIIVGYNF